MGTCSNLLEGVRYDLADYQVGLDYDDRLLYNYLNRLIGVMDSTLISVGSELIQGTETMISTVANQDYVDLTLMNNGQWDSIREVWIGEDRKNPVSVDLMNWKRKFRSGTAEPDYWALMDKQLLWEVNCDSAHDDLIIHYNKLNRPRLASFSDTFTADATTDVLTLASGDHTFVTGDGPVTVSNSGGSLPTGLSASTNYWIIFDPSDSDGIRLAPSKIAALNEKEYHEGYDLVVDRTYKIVEYTTLDFTACGAAANTVGTYFTCSTTGELGSGDRVLDTQSIDITAAGSGTHTLAIASGADQMPYRGMFDNLFAQMLVLMVRSKKDGKATQPDMIYNDVFRNKAFEDTVRRKFVRKLYSVDF